MPTEGLNEYPDDTEFTVTGATASNYSYSDGNVTFDLAITIPTMASGFPDGMFGDLAVDDIVISSGDAPSTIPATSATISGDGDTIQANIGSGIFTLEADGDWVLISTEGLAIDDPQPAFSPSSGVAGTFQIVSTISVQLGDNGRLVNSDGSEDSSGATSGSAGFAVRARGGTVNLDTGSNTWSSSVSMMTGSDVNIRREWRLTGGTAGSIFTFIDEDSGNTRSQMVPAGDEITLFATQRPSLVQGDGTVTDLGISAANADNADAIGGMVLNFVANGNVPAVIPANNIYFEYE